MVLVGFAESLPLSGVASALASARRTEKMYSGRRDLGDWENHIVGRSLSILSRA